MFKYTAVGDCADVATERTRFQQLSGADEIMTVPGSAHEGTPEPLGDTPELREGGEHLGCRGGRGLTDMPPR